MVLEIEILCVCVCVYVCVDVELMLMLISFCDEVCCDVLICDFYVYVHVCSMRIDTVITMTYITLS